LSLIANLSGATETPFAVETSLGTARFKLFHKTGGPVRKCVAFVSHGFQCYPAQTVGGNFGIYSFAYLVPMKTSLMRTRCNDSWAVEACRKFSDQPLAFATAGIIAAVVGAHSEPEETASCDAIAPMLDYSDIALFDTMNFSISAMQKQTDLQNQVKELNNALRSAKTAGERMQKKTEQEEERKKITQTLAFFDNNAVPLSEVLTGGEFTRFSSYLMHCCRPAWPPAGGTTTGSSAQPPDGLYAFDDAFHVMID
jgi:hypothetical protein